MASQKFKIVYLSSGTEEIIEAGHRPEREDEWFIFADGSGLILQIRAEDVKRIERVA
jgi:hypothetical protein